MKRIFLTLTVIFSLSLLFSACHNAQYDNAMESAAGASDSYSSEEAEYDENNRKVIKTAQISLNVDELESSIIQLKSFLKPIKGYVYNYEITNDAYEIDNYLKNIDSTTSVERISPNGSLSVRVPIAHADSFINYVLKSDAQIASLKIGDEDVTENLWERKEIANVYSKSGKAQKHKGNSKNIGYDNGTAIDAIRAKSTAAKMDYKTKYLWFDINMSAKPFYKSSTTIAVKNYRTPIHVSVANALVKGWHICADIIVGLITLWPLLLLMLFGYFLYRKYTSRYS